MLVLMLLVLPAVSVAQSADEANGARTAVPDATARNAVETKIREIYRDELEAATTAQTCSQLVERLLADAVNLADDFAAQYVILDLAREQAAAGADPQLLRMVLAAVAADFEIDEHQWYLAALRDAADTLRDPDACRRMAEDSLSMIDQATAAEQFDTAEQLLMAAAKLQAKARDAQLTRAVGERRTRLGTERRNWDVAQKAAETLAENPDDAAACLTRGRYLCFTRGDWDGGLPLLAKGNDSVLAQLAERSIDAQPETPVDQAALAATWWDEASRSRSNVTRYRDLLRGAHYWYTLALPGLSTLDLRLAETRIAEAEQTIGPVTVAVQPLGQTEAIDPSKLPPTLTLPLARGVDLVLRQIPPGKFMMGSPPDEPGRNGNESHHEVTISRPYYIGQSEVTRGQWTAVTGQPAPQSPNLVNRPVNVVSWFDASNFCAKLNVALAGKSPLQGYAFRLPTEAEWEYACRAGTTTATHFGDQLSSTQAWFDGSQPYNNAAPGVKPPQNEVRDVGSFQPNAWGLYDMHGNVQEWCWDWHGSYSASTISDPTGPSTGTEREARGGGYRNAGADCRSANRYARAPIEVNTDRGFRVVYGPVLQAAQ